MSNNEYSTATLSVYFLFRSMIIGLALYLPGCFFHPTRKALSFLMNLEAVQIAADLVRLAIVLTLLGLILQGVFHLMRGVIRLFSKDSKGVAN